MTRTRRAGTRRAQLTTNSRENYNSARKRGTALTDVAVTGPGRAETRRVELDLEGLSCRACARRVEKALNRIEGVRTAVDFGARVATVEADPGVSVADLCAAVAKAGYGAAERAEGAGARVERVERQQLAPLRAVFVAATALLRWLKAATSRRN